MLDLIQWRARKTPEAQALFFNGRWYSFREMEGRANRLANRLLALGLKCGDRVGVIAHNHLVHFDLLLAAPKIGVVFAPLNPYLDHAALVDAALQLRLAMVFADSRRQDIAATLGVPWARLSEYREWVLVGSLDLPPAPALGVDDPYIIYGTPRGAAVLPYRQVLLNARHAADAWGLSSHDSTVHCLPCYGPELNLLCLPLLYRGGRVVLMSAFDTDEYLGHLALHRVTVSALTPLMLRHLTSYSDFDDADLSSLNWLASIGAPAPVPVRHALLERGLKLRTLYPLAEAGPILFNASLDDTETRPELLGLPLPDVQLQVTLADGAPAQIGEAGSLSVVGSMVFSGYFENPQATAAVLSDGRCLTGMAVCADTDGQYLHHGVGSHAFSSNGVWIHPTAIECALLRLENVMDCAVVPARDATGNIVVVATVVLQEGVQRDDQSLAAELAPHLPPSWRALHFQRRKLLPRDAWGAVQHPQLAQQFEAAHTPGVLPG